MGAFLTNVPEAVWFAFAGALGIKLLELAELHQMKKVKRPDLKDWTYWLPFIILPFLGGGLAYAYTSDTELTPMLAINIGVSAPLMLRAMAQINPLERTIEPTQPGA